MRARDRGTNPYPGAPVLNYIIMSLKLNKVVTSSYYICLFVVLVFYIFNNREKYAKGETKSIYDAKEKANRNNRFY